MLKISKIPEVLRSLLSDGIEGACLMTSEGSILGSVFIDGSKLNETSLAAISSSIWGNYSQGNSELILNMTKLENGVVGVSTAGNGYLIALYGNEKATLGILRGRLESVGSHFSYVFDRLTQLK